MAEKIILELEGQVSAILVSADGGSATREVVSNPNNPNGVLRKSLGKLSYDAIHLQIGGATTNALFKWIADTWARHGSRKAGAIIKIDAAGRDAGRLEFTNALLTETTLPSFDTTQSQPATMTLKLLPASTVLKPASGALIGIPSMPAKTWLRRNFRLSIDGVDATKTVRINDVTIAVAALPAAGGSFNPGILSVTNLAVTLLASSAHDYLSWHQSFVIDGHNDPAHEKTGTLVMLSPNLLETYLTFTLHNLGIFKLVSLPPDPPTAGGITPPPMMSAEMYVNQPDFGFPI